MPDAQEQSIAGLTNLLLTAPETPIRFGSGELSMYRDIATMDQGPGVSERHALAAAEQHAAGFEVRGGRTAGGAIFPPRTRRGAASSARYEISRVQYGALNCIPRCSSIMPARAKAMP